MLETGLVAPGNDPRPCRTGWWSNAPALMKAWSQRPIDDCLASGGRPMLVLYGAQDGITPVPNVLSLRDELGDQVRLIEIADAATACRSNAQMRLRHPFSLGCPITRIRNCSPDHMSQRAAAAYPARCVGGADRVAVSWAIIAETTSRRSAFIAESISIWKNTSRWALLPPSRRMRGCRGSSRSTTRAC